MVHDRIERKRVNNQQEKSEVLCIIPARGGSKGVPGKNIRQLAGKPLISYAINEAQKSRYITRIIISTDDEKIAETGRQYGAEVPFMRPSELAADNATDLPVFQHALRWFLENENYKPPIIAHIRPTAPLRTVQHIDKGISMLLASDADALRSVCPAPKHPFKMWRFEGERIKTFLPEEICGKEPYNRNRQQLSAAYIQNGSVDITRWETIMEKNSMTGRVILGMLMDEQESVNIDLETDFLLAEELLKRRKETS